MLLCMRAGEIYGDHGRVVIEPGRRAITNYNRTIKLTRMSKNIPALALTNSDFIHAEPAALQDQEFKGSPLLVSTRYHNDEEKIKIIGHHFKVIMETLGLDLKDDSLEGTPHRVAKMFVKEIFSGLNPDNKPVISLFENSYQYHEILVEKNITVYSYCEHHFVPIIGKAHVGYIPNGKVIGLSK